MNKVNFMYSVNPNDQKVHLNLFGPYQKLKRLSFFFFFFLMGPNFVIFKINHGAKILEHESKSSSCYFIFHTRAPRMWMISSRLYSTVAKTSSCFISQGDPSPAAPHFGALHWFNTSQDKYSEPR